MDLGAVEAELRRRVEERRARGDYPPGLAESLDDQWAALVVQRDDAGWPGEEVDAALAAVDDAGRFASERIDLGGGRQRAVHHAVARLVTRQVEGILAQGRAYAGAVRAALGAQWSAVGVLESRQRRLEQRLEAALDRLARVERATGRPAPPGGHRHEGLAERFAAGPVLVLDGGPLDDLAARGLEPRAAEPGAGAGWGTGVLAGVLAGRAVERLDAGGLASLVERAARALRPGGLLVVEAANPSSLSAMSSWWADPTRVRPVDHRLVVDLCRRAGFATVTVEWHSPVPAGERPARADEHVDRLLFADQAFVAVATR